jgi:hypothetical protein
MVAAISAGRAILLGFAAGAAVVVLLFGLSAGNRCSSGTWWFPPSSSW